MTPSGWTCTNVAIKCVFDPRATKQLYCSCRQTVLERIFRRPTIHEATVILAWHEKLGFLGVFWAVRLLWIEAELWFCRRIAKNNWQSGIKEYRLKRWYEVTFWVWHLKFEFTGKMNDLNILDCSALFRDVQAGQWPSCMRATISSAGSDIDWFYSVAGGTYPPYRIFLKEIQASATKRDHMFWRAQKALRRKAERLYAVSSGDGIFWPCHCDCGTEQIWNTFRSLVWFFTIWSQKKEIGRLSRYKKHRQRQSKRENNTNQGDKISDWSIRGSRNAQGKQRLGGGHNTPWNVS